MRNDTATARIKFVLFCMMGSFPAANGQALSIRRQRAISKPLAGAQELAG
jgi:hypothetical protein